MSDSKNITAWLLLVLLAVAGGGFAVLGIVQSQHVPLQQAVTDTLAADNYTEVFSQTTPQGTQTEHVVFQAPNSLSGYEQDGNKRTYVVIIGTQAYGTLQVAANASTAHLTFYKETVAGAKSVDPAQRYLPYAKQATHVHNNGGTYTFALSQMGQVGAFVYDVSSWHVSHMTLAVPAARASVHLDITQVGRSPAVALPPGAKVIDGAPGVSGATGGAAPSGGAAG
jgi:hypothetical protein